jgi:MscS family membrane protein
MIKPILNSLFDTDTLSEPIQNWLFFASTLIVLFVLARLFIWILITLVSKVVKRTATEYDDKLLRSLEKPLTSVLLIFSVDVSLDFLKFSETQESLKNKIFFFALTMSIAWIIVSVLKTFINHFIWPRVNHSESKFDNQILPLIEKFAVYSIWFVALVLALDNAGYNIASLIAGLGLGGLAFALAAKDTLSNIFGGLTIFMDKPFCVKDRIIIEDTDGVVENIGIRSTKVIRLDGRTVTLPNSKFIGNSIVNVSSEASRKITLTLGLTYDTKPEELKEAMNTLKEISKQVSGHEEDCITAFTDFNSYSVDLTFIYFIKKGFDIFETQNETNLLILEEFNKKGLDMAFPTQSINLTKD